MYRAPFLCLVMAAISMLVMTTPARSEEKPVPKFYELRVYHAAEGKLDALNARFRDHTTRLFTRHGMTNVAYWVPVENPGRLLVYLLSYPDRPGRLSRKPPVPADPDWVSAKAASEESGPLLTKVDSRFLAPTDFSPEMKVDGMGKSPVFEMRTYTTTPGNLPRLLDRFRQHTVKLFTRHGMGHFGYFTPLAGQAGAEDTLIYFLVHPSVEAQATSFSAFRADPEWVKAKSASEAAAGGSLTVPDGVESLLLKATDFSPVP